MAEKKIGNLSSIYDDNRFEDQIRRQAFALDPWDAKWKAKMNIMKYELCNECPAYDIFTHVDYMVWTWGICRKTKDDVRGYCLPVDGALLADYNLGEDLHNVKVPDWCPLKDEKGDKT